MPCRAVLFAELTQKVAADHLAYETILPTYAFALGYGAEALSDECGASVLSNLELLLIGVADGTAAPADFNEYHLISAGLPDSLV